MTRIRKVFALSASERCLLAESLILVGLIRVALWVLPFRMLRPLVERFASSRAGAGSPDPRIIDEVTWAVAAAAGRVPGATCLTQALAARVLLARRGEPCDLRIGVARDERSGIRAHAWLEHRGTVILGGSDIDRWIPLV